MASHLKSFRITGSGRPLVFGISCSKFVEKVSKRDGGQI